MDDDGTERCQIEIVATILETCGRFLYNCPETHIRTDNLVHIHSLLISDDCTQLKTMMRLKNVKHLDPRLDTLVDNAYYMCKVRDKFAIT